MAGSQQSIVGVPFSVHTLVAGTDGDFVIGYSSVGAYGSLSPSSRYGITISAIESQLGGAQTQVVLKFATDTVSAEALFSLMRIVNASTGTVVHNLNRADASVSVSGGSTTFAWSDGDNAMGSTVTYTVSLL